jgi:hypothetical protein
METLFLIGDFHIGLPVTLIKTIGKTWFLFFLSSDLIYPLLILFLRVSLRLKYHIVKINQMINEVIFSLDRDKKNYENQK